MLLQKPPIYVIAVHKSLYVANVIFANVMYPNTSKMGQYVLLFLSFRSEACGFICHID